MFKSALLAVILLITGLIVGTGIGSIVFPQTVIQTETITETWETTVRETYSLTQTVTQSEIVTSTQTIEITKTSISTSTLTKTSTTTLTEFVTIEITVYPTGGELLMSDKGSGEKNTKPFTLNETSDLRIVVKIWGNPEWALLHWFLYPVGSDLYFDDGEVDRDTGTFEFYVYQVPAGNYYLHIVPANVKYEISVYKLTTG